MVIESTHIQIYVEPKAPKKPRLGVPSHSVYSQVAELPVVFSTKYSSQVQENIVVVVEVVDVEVEVEVLVEEVEVLLVDVDVEVEVVVVVVGHGCIFTIYPFISVL